LILTIKYREVILFFQRTNAEFVLFVWGLGQDFEPCWGRFVFVGFIWLPWFFYGCVLFSIRRTKNQI